ncbi:unnamed protein product [Sphenostylis stenocarpa]|uniref:Uncharacterized protein n=1 Tax=Sphenostylis stenocarpa TaxID=92480 RepID=A0AA86ST91_9FABA|nr:unnamed protein product [Sphenostylis stenocarpa]
MLCLRCEEEVGCDSIFVTTTSLRHASTGTRKRIRFSISAIACHHLRPTMVSVLATTTFFLTLISLFGWASDSLLAR